jgi:hypothetical protein
VEGLAAFEAGIKRRVKRMRRGDEGRISAVFVVRGTRKLLVRIGGVTASPLDRSTTKLGDWYATVLFWKPQVALFVNETTLLPVLLPFAPGATLVDRFRPALAGVLHAHRVDARFIEQELVAMAESRVAATANRSVLGVMNEFVRLAPTDRPPRKLDLTDLSVWLSRTPCGPLYRRHVSPDRELTAFVNS